MATKTKAKPFKRKCKLCGKYITDENDAVEFKGGYVHTDCFAASLKTIQIQRTEKEEREKTQTKKQASKPSTPEFKIPKTGLSEEEYAEKVAFFDTVKEILKIDRIPARIYAMTDKVKEKYPYFTYPGMAATLEFCQRRDDIELAGDCIGIIPYYYDAAMAEVEQIKQGQENIEATLDQMTTETEVVTFHKAARRKLPEKINIEEIG